MAWRITVTISAHSALAFNSTVGGLMKSLIRPTQYSSATPALTKRRLVPVATLTSATSRTFLLNSMSPVITIPSAPLPFLTSSLDMWSLPTGRRRPFSATEQRLWQTPPLNPGVDQFAPGGEGAGFTTLTDIYEWRGNFTKIIRNHTLTAGLSYETDKLTEDSNSDGLTFSADQTSDPQNGGGNTGYGLASYLLGTAAVGAKRDTAGSTTGQNGIGGYFMDKWKATSRLTLNVGLRYDFQAYPLWGNLKDPVSAVGEIDFNNGTYILQRPVASCANTGNIAPCIPGTSLPANVVISPNNRLWQNTKTNFQPRLGLAYRLTDKMVLRASFGITDDLWAGITQSGQNASGSWPSN